MKPGAAPSPWQMVQSFCLSGVACAAWGLMVPTRIAVARPVGGHSWSAADTRKKPAAGKPVASHCAFSELVMPVQ